MHHNMAFVCLHIKDHNVTNKAIIVTRKTVKPWLDPFKYPLICTGSSPVKKRVILSSLTHFTTLKKHERLYNNEQILTVSKDTEKRLTNLFGFLRIPNIISVIIFFIVLLLLFFVIVDIFVSGESAHHATT